MRVFVTGATGFVGTVVVQELIANGHQVLGLARSDESAKKLKAAGADVRLGSLEDLQSLRDGAAACDGVVHCAFNHDFSKFVESSAAERAAIETIASALDNNKPFVVTSGTAFLPKGKVGTEQDRGAAPAWMPRAPLEALVFSLFDRGLRAMIVRLPPSVHGEGDHHGFIPRMINVAREKGVSAYIGEGNSTWSAVHRLDAARLYRLALEKGKSAGVYHAVADEAVPTRDIAGVIARKLNIPVVSKQPDQVAEHFGAFALFAQIDTKASSTLTQEQLGWKPTQPDLLTDLESGHYFHNKA